MNADLALAIALIKRYEGCRLKAYRCAAGVWTIGWGETEGVKEGDIWTQEQADTRLVYRAKQFLMAVLKKCPILWMEDPEKAAACASLAYNIGVGAFGASTVRRRTARQDFQGAANAFLLWNKAGGRVLRGLTRRREHERRVYLGAGL